MAGTGEELPETLADVARNLSHYNSVKEMEKRITFAKDNTYARQLSRIEKHLLDHQLITSSKAGSP